MKTKIIFLCHGNICRSPMAEYIMKSLVKKAGIENEFEITSGAVSTEEIGNPIYPPAQRKLNEKAIPYGNHRAHKITPQEFAVQDVVIVMDNSNIRLLKGIVGDSPQICSKIHKMMEFAATNNRLRQINIPDVADPWYTGDFEQTYIDITEGCKGLIAYCQTNRCNLP